MRSRSLTQEAVDIWTQGTGRQWFVYDRHARLTIRMIYDERQATSQLQMDAENKIDQQLLDQKTSRQALESQKTALDRSAHELTITAHTLNQSTQALSQAISQASNDSQLQYYRSQMARLDTERHALNAKIDAYHAEQARYNQAVQAYNDQTARIGAAIDEANAHFGGRSFDKGVFTGQYIDIFEFQTTDDLRLTLAHELGHALDIDHNDDPKALMYPIIGEQDAANFRLRPADLALLESR